MKRKLINRYITQITTGVQLEKAEHIQPMQCNSDTSHGQHRIAQGGYRDQEREIEEDFKSVALA